MSHVTTPVASGYSEQEEYLLSLWADRALCYKIMHESAQAKFTRQHMLCSIPVIILSTLTGTASIGISSYVPTAYLSNAQLVIGALNLFAGILGTLQNFFRAAEMAESHRNAAVGWGKLYRSIFVELSLARDKRKTVSDFMRISKNEYDRLVDNSPSLPAAILSHFRGKLRLNPSIALPEECGNLLHTSSWEHVKTQRIASMELAAAPALIDLDDRDRGERSDRERSDRSERSERSDRSDRSPRPLPLIIDEKNDGGEAVAVAVGVEVEVEVEEESRV